MDNEVQKENLRRSGLRKEIAETFKTLKEPSEKGCFNCSRKTDEPSKVKGLSMHSCVYYGADYGECFGIWGNVWADKIKPDVWLEKCIQKPHYLKKWKHNGQK